MARAGAGAAASLVARMGSASGLILCVVGIYLLSPYDIWQGAQPGVTVNWLSIPLEPLRISPSEFRSALDHPSPVYTDGQIRENVLSKVELSQGITVRYNGYKRRPVETLFPQNVY